MDETSLRMWPGVRKGLVSRSWRKTGPYPLRVQRKAGLSLRRSAISYVAFIADDDTVQETLPQILIGNEHLLTRAAMDELNAEPLACRVFFLLRRKSAWLDAKCLVRLIRLLGEALRPLRENYTFFVLHGWMSHSHRFTCYPRNPPSTIAFILHPRLHDRIFAAARHARLFPVQEVFDCGA